MQQLSGLDNAFLLMEAGGQLGHVGSLVHYDAQGMSGAAFRDAIEETIERRLSQLLPYRRRLVEVPLNLDRPYSRTRTSISTSICDTSPCRRPVTTSSSPSWSRGSTRARSTAASRSGRST